MKVYSMGLDLCVDYTVEEKEILKDYAGNDYEVMTHIEGDSFVLCVSGELSYEQCFGATDNAYSNRQHYEKVIPYRMLRVFSYYLMNTKDDLNIWYRGSKNQSGNWEYECCSDSLKEAIEFL